jgi:hypothetical protein
LPLKSKGKAKEKQRKSKGKAKEKQRKSKGKQKKEVVHFIVSFNIILLKLYYKDNYV